jgi:hypothetical protein
MVTPDRLGTSNDENRVVPLRPRGGINRRWPRSPARPPNDGSVDDLTKFEQSEPEDDYRHRMMVNVLGLVVTVLLVVAGVWLANKIADTRKVQDCVLSGRNNCTPIDVPPIQRY